MKKRYKITGIDCGHCAANLEKELNKLEVVDSVKINFLTEKIIIEANDNNFDETVEAVKKAAKKSMPDVEIQ